MERIWVILKDKNTTIPPTRGYLGVVGEDTPTTATPLPVAGVLTSHHREHCTELVDEDTNHGSLLFPWSSYMALR